MMTSDASGDADGGASARARADAPWRLSDRPELLFADEPTGNLDGTNGALVANLLFDLVHESGAALVLVTHDVGLAARAHRTVTMGDGRIIPATDGREL